MTAGPDEMHITLNLASAAPKRLVELLEALAAELGLEARPAMR